MKSKLKISITLLLIFQVWLINYLTTPNEIQVDSLLSLKRENYVMNLEKKFEKLAQSGLYQKLRTNIVFTKDTKISEVVFIWDKKDKEKYKSELEKSKESFDSSTFINLYYYHKHYINTLYRYTDNSMIWESFLSMIDTIKEIDKEYPNIGSEEEIKDFGKLGKDFIQYLEDMNTSRNEMISFDKKIEELYGIEPYKYKFNQLGLDGELEKFTLLLEMFHKTNNLFINIPKNKSEDPFIKFNTFVNIYDDTYVIYKSLVKQYNKKVEEQNTRNKWILSIISILILVLTFWKEKYE